MRNIEKYPQNEHNHAIYLNKEDRELLNKLSQLSGLTPGRVLAKIVHEALPKAHMVPKTYEVHELTIE